MPALLRRPIGEILRDRSDARRAFLRPQIERTLVELRRNGAACEVIGSFARVNETIDAETDLDILVERKGALTEGEIWDLAWSNLTDVDVDLVFAEHLPPRKVALMKEHARG
jgi:predicted nucleotidyltransferase